MRNTLCTREVSVQLCCAVNEVYEDMLEKESTTHWLAGAHLMTCRFETAREGGGTGTAEDVAGGTPS